MERTLTEIMNGMTDSTLRNAADVQQHLFLSTSNEPLSGEAKLECLHNYFAMDEELERREFLRTIEAMMDTYLHRAIYPVVGDPYAGYNLHYANKLASQALVLSHSAPRSEDE